MDWSPQISEVVGVLRGFCDSVVLGDEELEQVGVRNGFESDLHSACQGKVGRARHIQPCFLISLLTFGVLKLFPRLVSAITVVRCQGVVQAGTWALAESAPRWDM